MGILLLDVEQEQLLVLFRKDWDHFVASEDDREVLVELSKELATWGAGYGSSRLLSYFEDTLSLSLRITNREFLETTDLETTMDDLFRQFIAKES